MSPFRLELAAIAGALVAFCGFDASAQSELNPTSSQAEPFEPMTAQGINVCGKAGAPRAQLRRVADVALAQVTPSTS